MPVITIKDPTLVERLKRIKPQPAEDSFDDVLYELLKRAESKGEYKPTIKGLDNLPQLVAQEVMRALDGKLLDTLKSALLPSISNLSLEIPVELSLRVRLRLEPVFDVSPTSPPAESHDSSAHDPPSNGKTKAWRTVELDKMEQRVREHLRQRGGCFEGPVRELARALGMVDKSLIRRLYKRLHVTSGKVCLPEAVAQA